MAVRDCVCHLESHSSSVTGRFFEVLFGIGHVEFGQQLCVFFFVGLIQGEGSVFFFFFFLHVLSPHPTPQPNMAVSSWSSRAC